MDAEDYGAQRALPIDATLLSAVLLRMRRDASGRMARWTLGERGAMELDVHFSPVPTTPGVSGPVWRSTGRLWDPDRLGLAPITVEVLANAADECGLQLLPEAPLQPWWQERTAALVALANAAIDELAEELLWHASRIDIAQPS
jgi:hypothetical protein